VNLGLKILWNLIVSEKETGKDYKTGEKVTKGGTMGGDDLDSKVMRHMHKVMGAGRMGAGGAIQERQEKVPGKKRPTAGEYGSERESPETNSCQNVVQTNIANEDDALWQETDLLDKLL
jgi:hypothetical protein